MPVRNPTVAVAGDLDLCAVDPVALALDDLLALGHRTVQLDLSHVDFLDCAGLGVVVRMHHQFVAAGGSLTLTRVSHPVARMIRMTGLQDLLILEDRPSAGQPDRRITAAAAAGPQS